MSHEYLERILKARVYDVAIQSPLEEAPRLSRRLGNAVLFKREDLQPVFSFKVRGAYNKIAHLSETIARRGVICASAGNHAQGVALAAKRRGIPATIVMPQTTPRIKVQAVIDLGGEVILHGDEYDEAYDHALAVARERQLTFIHPFDDPDVIAGQGTIGMEILRQQPGETLDAIFVAVGGGGLIAGVAAYVKYLFPKIRVIGVEPEDADAMYRSLQARKRITLERVGIFADGVAVRRVGEEPFRLAQEYVDEVITVNTDEICAAIQDIFEDNRSIVEPAGALPVAGIKRYVAREQCRDRRFVAINCGANMNFDRLRHVAERADIGGQREALVAVEIPEQQGQLPALLRNARPAQRHRVQLSLRRRRRARTLRRPRACGRSQGEGSAAQLAARGRLPGRRHERQRDGEAARALHGRRPRRAASSTSGCSASSSRSVRARC